jgi:hypothetical protein|uniref:Uncharacterized protein n=1 Tax=Picea glauca TaxID=3330 RepID=A0A101LU40_PICGL|nr:hypothetical protein ABT39_MTgene3452 [Picea glauca]
MQWTLKAFTLGYSVHGLDSMALAEILYRRLQLIVIRANSTYCILQITTMER